MPQVLGSYAFSDCQISIAVSGHHRFAPGACERLEPFLSERIVGQDLAIRQFSDAVCDLLRREGAAAPGKPLIMSGPHRRFCPFESSSGPDLVNSRADGLHRSPVSLHVSRTVAVSLICHKVTAHVANCSTWATGRR